MNTSTEEKKAMAELALRQLLYSLPIAGPIMEVMFEYSGKVKQERFNRFVQLLDEAFLKNGISLYELQTEENVDLFETIFRKVTQTKSEQKRIGFKNLLIHGLQHREEVDHCEIFSELLLNISEKELAILHYHKKFLIEEKGALKVRNNLKNELYELNNKKALAGDSYQFSHLAVHQKSEEKLNVLIDQAEAVLNQYKQDCIAERFSISEHEYKFFLQCLFGKGLLIDDGVGAIGTGSFGIMSLTKFGIKFLAFIEEE